MSSNELLTKREAAQLLRVSTRTLDRWRSAGAIASVTLGRQVRFSTTEVQRAITEGVAA